MFFLIKIAVMLQETGRSPDLMKTLETLRAFSGT